MKTIAPNLYVRGKNGSIYMRRRIPKALKEAYPKKTHIVLCLRTSDIRVAKGRQRIEDVRLDAEFSLREQERKKRLADKSVARSKGMSDAQLKSLADTWIRQVLLCDEHRRCEGLDDDEFDELDTQLRQHRAQLGRMLATGRTDKILPAMHGFIYLCNLDVELSAEESRRAAGIFLRAVISGLDHQLQRQEGQVVVTDVVAPATPMPRDVAAKQPSSGPSWSEVFVAWRDYVPGRPKSTAIATQTPWLELQRVATEHGMQGPAEVTPELMRLFVSRMTERGLGVVTINERLAKIRSLFKVAKGKGVLCTNPASDTLGLKESSFARRKNKRLPFDEADLSNIFSSPIFNEQQLRSQGQAGEATYWIPVLMYYTGARTEEVAGLALADIVKDPVYGWYFNIIDRPSPEDDLFDEDTEHSAKTSTQWRTLKNAKSIRKVPVAQQLIDLGLFRYVDWCRAHGHQSLFPNLVHDWHGKLSGAFSKFFGRYKVENLGIQNPKKVLYSFRHTMKDAMTQSNIPSKYLQRILGHASGDGDVTDGYGVQDVPIGAVVQEFQKIQFFPISAHPWEQGKGFVRYGKKGAVRSHNE